MVSARSKLVKASVVSVDYAASNAAPVHEDDAAWQAYNVLEPPFDPRHLCTLFSETAALRPNVDVYVTNIDGFGHQLKALIDPGEVKVKDGVLTAPDKVREQVREALTVSRLAAGDPTPDITEVSVDSQLRLLQISSRLERLRLEHFFSTCSETSFDELRARARTDLEVTGNAYWEVVRDAEGTPFQLVHLPSVSMRLQRVDTDPVEMVEPRRVSRLEVQRRTVRRRVRRYVQLLNGQFVAYFKEFGDRRVMSARTGHFYKDQDALLASEPNSRAATEVQHFRVYSPVSAYGVPRWAGAMLAVLGSRGAEQVNYTYFDNKAVPPLAILVSGGQLAKGASEKIQNYIRDNIKGRDNFHKILILEATGASGTVSGVGSGARVAVEIKPLMEAQQNDALFQTYDANNTDKVGAQFRLPKILRGDMKDFNRSTAEAALQYAEQQIFQPERLRFDHWVSERLLPELDARYHEFVTNAVSAKDPPSLTEMATKLSSEGGLSVNELREVAGEILGKPMAPISEPWAQLPFKMVLAQLAAAGAPAGEGASKTSGLEAEAARLVALRRALEVEEASQGAKSLSEGRSEDATRVIQVPAEEFNSWLEPAES